MSLFRELSQEEQEKIEKLHILKNQIADLELRQMEKRKEIEFFEQRKGMDYVPVIVWGLLCLSQILLICIDLFFGSYNTRMSWAIVLASMVPVVLIFCGFFFFKSLREYILRNSKNAAHMKKAKENGIENRWLRSAQLQHDMEQINTNLKMMKKEYGHLKLEVDKIQETQFQ